MKKIYLLLLLPLSLTLFSCHEESLSPVDLTLTLSGVTQTQEGFYTVSGDNVTIDRMTVKAIDGKNSEVANVVFNFDGVPLIGVPGNPFPGTFSTEGIPVGRHTIGAEGNLLQEGVSIQVFAVNYPIIIVVNSENLPSDAPEIGTYSASVRLSN